MGARTTTEQRIEFEIRDTSDHTSDSAANDAGATVLTDTLHPARFRDEPKVSIYIMDTHDASFDVELEEGLDSDYGRAVTHQTFTTSTGTDAWKVTLEEPVDSARLVARTSALASAPTGGSLELRVITAE